MGARAQKLVTRPNGTRNFVDFCRGGPCVVLRECEYKQRTVMTRVGAGRDSEELTFK